MNRYRPDPDALAATLTDGAVLLNLRTNRYHSLNATGARVWQLLVEGRNDEEIIRTMISEFDVTAEVATREIASIIGALSAAELIIPNDD